MDDGDLSLGVKGIDRVSPIKSKGTGNSDSPRSRRITMSERDMLVGITPAVSDKLTDLEKDKVNVGKDKAPKHKFTDLEKDKVNVGKDKALKHKAPVKNMAAVLCKARKQKTSVKKPATVVEKPDAVVDKAPKHKAPAKKPASVVVQDKDNVTAPAKEPASVVVQDKDNVVVNDPAELDQEKDKEKHKAPAKEPASVVGRVCDVAKQIMFHVEDALKNEAADVKEKSDGKGKKSTVDKDNDKSKSMFDGTLATFDAKWESFSNQVNAQFKGNKGGLALEGIDLKKLFARHLKEYGHIRHAKIAKLKQTIPKLKRKTKRDMLRRLRFKFVTKILLHEINVLAEKMLELAKDFDKIDPVEKMVIIIDAFKNREERERI
ncbi:hypothetical protein Tco_1282873 [Tanacetum coccineum]